MAKSKSKPQWRPTEWAAPTQAWNPDEPPVQPAPEPETPSEPAVVVEEVSSAPEPSPAPAKPELRFKVIVRMQGDEDRNAGEYEDRSKAEEIAEAYALGKEAPYLEHSKPGTEQPGHPCISFYSPSNTKGAYVVPVKIREE